MDGVGAHQDPWSLPGQGAAVFSASSAMLCHTHSPTPGVPSDPPNPGLPCGLCSCAPSSPWPARLPISCSFLHPSSHVASSSKSPLCRSAQGPVDLCFLFKGWENGLQGCTGGRQWLSGAWERASDMWELPGCRRRMESRADLAAAALCLARALRPRSWWREAGTGPACLPSLGFILGGEEGGSKGFSAEELVVRFTCF